MLIKDVEVTLPVGGASFRCRNTSEVQSLLCLKTGCAASPHRCETFRVRVLFFNRFKELALKLFADKLTRITAVKDIQEPW